MEEKFYAYGWWKREINITETKTPENNIYVLMTVYVYAHTHIYTHACIYVFIYTFIFIYVYLNIYTK